MILKEKVQTAIRICMACDENYAIHCAAAVASIIDNHKSPEKLEFYILNREISQKSKKRLENLGNTEKSSLKLVDVDPSEFKTCPSPKNTHFTLETYFRLKLPDFFPDFDKILYLDSDITVLGDIKELWKFDVDDVFAGVCADIVSVEHIREFIGDYQNFNAGVMVINLKKWREENISQKCFDFVNMHTEKIFFVDQDVLNSVLIPKIKYFPRFWNLEYMPLNDVVSKLYPEEEIRLIHHISRMKPWNTPFIHIYADKYFKYLRKTPWRHHIFRLKADMLIKSMKKSLFIYFQNLGCKKRIEKAVKNRRVILWGASVFISKIINEYGLSSDNIIGIIDRDEKKSGQKIGIYEIFSPNELKKLRPNLIISAVLFQTEMKKYIEEELKRAQINAQIIDDLFTEIKDY